MHGYFLNINPVATHGQFSYLYLIIKAKELLVGPFFLAPVFCTNYMHCHRFSQITVRSVSTKKKSIEPLVLPGLHVPLQPRSTFAARNTVEPEAEARPVVVPQGKGPPFPAANQLSFA
jgi:hypothetical protein